MPTSEELDKRLESLHTDLAVSDAWLSGYVAAKDVVATPGSVEDAAERMQMVAGSAHLQQSHCKALVGRTGATEEVAGHPGDRLGPGPEGPVRTWVEIECVAGVAFEPP